MAKLDRKAASLGRRRAEHVRQVLEADVASVQTSPKRFASLSLKGRHALGRGSTNAAVRQALSRRAYEDRQDFAIHRKNGRQPVPCVFPD